ncbi:peptide cleavage/export ABC transporter [Bombilactobacillus thymidiniphilus]|uniref:Peptide cleavage/export ABC transporter n=1 Tax=Bombilactobacillus thymidiniphilus TaxID=2923363 RepID=A0ABY4PG35_9LACO|nr:peptide cleavage/export ABC transporter [Bombilactobacillus thymidiniphilus]UQS84282.1 peptide cleavage/export ABC transporter [Bombilactobacillus thymidiniphilus]
MNFRKNYVAQIDEKDCGVATLAMILRYYGSQVPLAQLRTAAQTTQQGTTAFGIKQAAQNYKLTVNAVRATWSQLQAAAVSDPFIVNVVKNKNLAHYYVILKITKTYVYIADPDPVVGLTKLSHAQFLQQWQGIVLFFKPMPDYEPIVTPQQTLWRFLPLFAEHKGILSLIFLTAFLVTLISIASAYFLQVLIDRYIPKQSSSWIMLISASLLLAYVVQAVCSYVQKMMLTAIGQKLSAKIILQYIKHVLTVPLSFFTTRQTGDILARFNDANQIIAVLADSLLTIGLDLLIVVMTAIVLWIQSPLLCGLAFVVLPFYIIIVWFFKRPLERSNRHQLESGAQLDSEVITDVEAIETIKALACEPVSYQRVKHQFTKALHNNWHYVKLDQLQQALKLFIRLAISVIVLWLGSKLVIQHQLSIGQLLAFNSLLLYFINPLQSIIDLQPKLQNAQVANQRLNEILIVAPEDNSQPDIKNSHSCELILQKISYSYGFGAPVLRNINLTIATGDKLAIVGRSGSGKSTLAKLLVHFFVPDTGQILLNQQDISKINPRSLRRLIAYIPQEPALFTGTIKENLLLGADKAVGMREIKQACASAQIKTEIENLPFQYDTYLDEHAATLSTGQKQRLTIARALLSPAQILILDESTSNLDTLTEQALVTELLHSSKTIIFIAHRLAVAKRAPRIIVLKNGEIAEQGTHEQLASQSGIYQHLWQAAQ